MKETNEILSQIYQQQARMIELLGKLVDERTEIQLAVKHEQFHKANGITMEQAAKRFMQILEKEVDGGS